MTRDEWKDWAAAIERPRLEAEAKERERAVQEMYWRCLQGAANMVNMGHQQLMSAYQNQCQCFQCQYNRGSATASLFAGLFGSGGSGVF